MSIIPGWFPVGAVVGSIPEYTFLGSDVDATNAASYSFISQPFGTAVADRLIVVAITGRRGVSRTISSVTIGGVSASQVVFNSGTSGLNPDFFPTALYRAAVPTGTSGTIAVTWSGGMDMCAVAHGSLIRYKSATATDTGSDHDEGGAPTPSISLNVSAGGVVIAAAGVQSNTSFALSNVDQDAFTTETDQTSLLSAHRADLAADATYAVAGSGTANEAVLVGASWR